MNITSVPADPAKSLSRAGRPSPSASSKFGAWDPSSTGLELAAMFFPPCLSARRTASKPPRAQIATDSTIAPARSQRPQEVTALYPHQNGEAATRRRTKAVGAECYGAAGGIVLVHSRQSKMRYAHAEERRRELPKKGSANQERENQDAATFFAGGRSFARVLAAAGSSKTIERTRSLALRPAAAFRASITHCNTNEVLKNLSATRSKNSLQGAFSS